MTSSDKQLTLSLGLTAKTQKLCLGLESGATVILELVTATTAVLLWWFGKDPVFALNFRRSSARHFREKCQASPP